MSPTERLLPGELARPAIAERRGRVAEIVAAARQILESEGAEALTMRRLADELGVQAPSLYKHFASKAAVEAAVIEEAMTDIGEACHRAIQESPEAPLGALLSTYRIHAKEHPDLYRLATGKPFPRQQISPQIEAWAGNPFYVVAGEPNLAQALWSFAHGMVVLEIDDRYTPGSDLDATWSAGAEAFERSARAGRARLARTGRS